MVGRAAPDVHTFCPVITISSPSTSPRVCTPARSDRGRARRTPGSTVLAGDDPGQEVRPLLRRSVHDDRRADQRLAHAAHDPRHARPGGTPRSAPPGAPRPCPGRRTPPATAGRSAGPRRAARSHSRVGGLRRGGGELLAAVPADGGGRVPVGQLGQAVRARAPRSSPAARPRNRAISGPRSRSMDSPPGRQRALPGASLRTRRLTNKRSTLAAAAPPRRTRTNPRTRFQVR